MYNRKVLKVMVDYFSIKQPQLWMKSENQLSFILLQGPLIWLWPYTISFRNLSFLPPVLLIYLAHLYFTLVILYCSILSLLFYDFFFLRIWLNYGIQLTLRILSFNTNIKTYYKSNLVDFFFISEEAVLGLKKNIFAPLKPHFYWSGL